ncbi:receptor activity-modifying protein 3-like isoform X3 [Polypterus senegalus]|nr:receptor activity-modifying protein 3-like isoform X3 [Polypterus senegalus]
MKLVSSSGRSSRVFIVSSLPASSSILFPSVRYEPANMSPLPAHPVWPYAELVMCTKEVSWDSGCDYPNPLTEEFFLQIHTEYFSNCSTQAVNLEPPETVVMFLTITCVSMVIFLSGFITWKNSRRNLTSKDTMVYFELNPWTESHSVK